MVGNGHEFLLRMFLQNSGKNLSLFDREALKEYARKFKETYEPRYNLMKWKIYKNKSAVENYDGGYIQWEEYAVRLGYQVCNLCLAIYPQEEESEYCPDCEKILRPEIREALQEWSDKEDEKVLDGEKLKDPSIQGKYKKHCKLCDMDFQTDNKNQPYCDICKISIYPIFKAKNKNRNPHIQMDNIKISLDSLNPSFHGYDEVLDLFSTPFCSEPPLSRLAGYDYKEVRYLKHCKMPFLAETHRQKHHPDCDCKKEKNRLYQTTFRDEHPNEILHDQNKKKKDKAAAIGAAVKIHGKQVIDRSYAGNSPGNLSEHAIRDSEGNIDFEKEWEAIYREHKRYLESRKH